MFNDLVALGYGLVVFAVIVGVASVVLANFSGSVGCSGSVAQGTWNATAGKCTNASANNDPSGASYTNINYMLTQFSSSGLAGWTPAVIAISVGLMFLGAFLIGKSKKGRY